MTLHSDTRTLGALALGRSLSVTLILATTVIVGRALGPDGFGRWSLMVAAATLAHAVLISWTHASTIRFGAEEWARHGTLRRTLGARVPIILAGAAVIAFLFLVDPGRLFTRVFGLTSYGAAAAGLYCLSLWLAAEVQSTMQVSGAMARHALLVPGAAALLIATVGASWMLGGASAEILMCAVAAVSLGFWACIWLWASRSAIPHGIAVERAEISRQLRYAWPLVPAFAVGYVATWAGYVIVELWRTPQELGTFGLAHQSMFTAGTASGILTTLLGPRLVERHVANPTAAHAYVSSIIPTGLTMWLLLSIWLVAALPPTLAMTAGREYAGSPGLAAVLAVSMPGLGVTALYTVLFNFQQRLTATLAYNTVVMIFSLGLSLMLVPQWGAIGACAAMAAASIVGQALYLTDQHRAVGVAPWRAWLLFALAFALGVTQLAAGTSWLPRVAWALAATAAVAGVARARGLVDAALVRRLTTGVLAPVGVWLTRVLVPAAAR